MSDCAKCSEAIKALRAVVASWEQPEKMTPAIQHMLRIMVRGVLARQTQEKE